MDKEQHTAVKKKMTSCVFDHVMFFNLNKLEREEIEEAIITVSVFDADTFSANDLIGLYQFDMKSIYFRPHHEVSAAPGCSVPGAPRIGAVVTRGACVAGGECDSCTTSGSASLTQ